VEVQTSSPPITRDALSAATAELTSAGDTSDFALTPARLPQAMYRAMRTTWHAFHQGVEAFIDMHEGDLRRITAAMSLPPHLDPVWDSLPPQDWALIARPDMIISDGTPLIVDVNSSSLAVHFATNDMLLRAHRSPQLRGFFADAGEPHFVMGHYTDMLRRFMTNDNDIVALSYFAEEDADGPSPARFHYQAEIDELKRLGLKARMTHIEDLEVAGDAVYHQGQRVGLIHRYFIQRHDDPAQMDHIARLASAAQKGLVVIWTSLWCAIFDNKAIIAMLSDERFTDGIRPSLAAALSHAVPWTRSIDDRYTTWRDTKIDLPAWIAQNRSHLVMKPALGGMGRAVTIGRETSPSVWEAQIDRALAAADAWVVQELLICDDQEILLVDRTGATHREQGPAVYGAFILDAEFIGAVCRHGRHGYSRLMINGLTGAIATPVYWGDA
jgi:hypothetical protein